MKFLRSLGLLFVMVVLFQAVGAGLVGAAEKDSLEQEDTGVLLVEKEKEVVIEYVPGNEAQINATRKNIIYQGRVVGWFVDGGIKWATGKAPSDWVAWGLDKITTPIKNYLSTPMYSMAIVNSYGVVTPSSCVTYPCPISAASTPIDDSEPLNLFKEVPSYSLFKEE